ncbi:unnamed protein product [Mesocestoides corti]|uniref:G-protein coupled receptors family 3 profile domain-containing protein n=1 Tax=Mesocestoides corti TaxID=53468 RepID=A0A158QUI9_MESCO|nr:unnamed protein product [Mesocestoides corti]
MDKYGICSEIERSIDNKETEEAFVDLAMEIFQPDRKAKVVVCFCQGETMAGIFKAMKTLGLEGRGYMFIGTDGWSDRLDVLGPVVNAKTEERAYSRLALGSFSIKLHSPKVEGFDEYFTSLTPDTHHNVNPWFTEFWEQKFDCTIRNTGDGKRKQCTGQESLKNLPFQQDNKLSLLNLAIYVVALALHRVQEIVCGVGRPGVCAGLLPVNGSFLRQELLKVNFTDRNGDTIYFDENGDPPASYDILNYQQTVNARGEEVFEYVQIARWKHGRMEFVDEDKIQWQVIEAATPNSTIVGPVKSYCSEPCGPWEEKVGFHLYINEENSTENMLSTQLVRNSAPPPSDKWGMSNALLRTGSSILDCVPIEPEFIRWTNPGPLAAIVFAAIGALMAIIILVVFIVHRNTAVVKASTRELMWVILVAMLVAHFSVLIVFFRPSPLTCALHRSLPSIAFAIIYAALVTKTNRIARILEGSKRILLKKQRFLSTTAQLVITLALTTIEIIVVATMLVIEPPNTRLKFSEDLTQATMLCDTTKSGNVIPLAFPIFLIAMCTIYAIKTRNLPQNFNEAKFIGFTMYTTCVLWLAFLPVYLSGYETEVTLTISISISASIALVILFIPKTYIILCRPEKNSRMSFITAKDIRCHIGVLQTNVDTGKKKSHKKYVELLNMYQN